MALEGQDIQKTDFPITRRGYDPEAVDRHLAALASLADGIANFRSAGGETEVVVERQQIERRDFPVGRRGYDPDAVDAHLADLAERMSTLTKPSRRTVSERTIVAKAKSPSAGSYGLAPSRSVDRASVMVVHGQDDRARKAMFGWLRSIGLKPREWTQLVAATESGSPYIGDVLDLAFEQAAAVVVLFTPDEHVRLRDELDGGAPRWRLQSRPNVMFEAGRAFGRHPERTVLVVLGEQELPTDLAGRHYVRLGTVRALRDLASRLQTAGCPIDESGDDWLDASQFPDHAVTAEPTT